MKMWLSRTTDTSGEIIEINDLNSLLQLIRDEGVPHTGSDYQAVVGAITSFDRQLHSIPDQIKWGVEIYDDWRE